MHSEYIWRQCGALFSSAIMGEAQLKPCMRHADWVTPRVALALGAAELVQPELSRIVAILRFAVHALSMRSI